MSDIPTTREKLIRRLRYLWTFEFFDSFYLPAMLVVVARTLDQPIGLFAAYGTGLTILLLWQGAAYWRLTLQAVRRGINLGAGTLHWYVRFKRLNWILLALMPLALGASIWLAGRLRWFDLIAGMAFYLLALAEQVNYYYYQLMYDNLADLRYLARYKRLKRAKLARALESLEEG